VFGGISMLNAADEAERISWNQTGYRLIPSRFPPVSIYEGLVANDLIDGLVEIENLTNPRLKAIQRLTEAANGPGPNRLQNWNHAPFAYANPEGSLFFGADRPCLELALDRQTALAVSVMRRQRFLARTEEPAVGLDMRMLSTPVTGVFLDLRPLGAQLGTVDRRSLGETVPGDVDGVLYSAPERPTGHCVAVLNGSTLGRTIQANHYRFLWNGRRMVSLYAFDDDGRELLPETLTGEADILAA